MKKYTAANLVTFVILPVFIFASWIKPKKAVREFYQITVYHYSQPEQEKILDNYLEKALLPALHRMQISNVGVLKAIANDTSNNKNLYVLIPLTSVDMVTKIADKLAADKLYQDAGTAYINAPYTAAPYNRMETILLKSFHLAPTLQLPKLNGPKKDRVYELRSYESATEKIFRNKVHMFNEGDEIGLFKRLNFNAIFYSEVIAGGKMPNLMYMTSFENMQDRDAHWKSFGSDPYWKKLSSMPEYQKNVSHIDIIFLRPAEYSDF
jgi:NIPSNAP